MKLSDFLNLNVKEQKEHIKIYGLIESDNSNELMIAFAKTLELLDEEEPLSAEKIKKFEKDILKNMSAIAIYSGRIMNANSSANAVNHFSENKVNGLTTNKTKNEVIKYHYVGNATYISLMKCFTKNHMFEGNFVSMYELSIINEELFEEILSEIGFSKEFLDAFREQVIENKERYKTEDIDPTIKQIFVPVNETEYNIIGIINSGKLAYSVSQEVWNIRRDELKERRISTINIPVGGTQPQNAGEIINNFNGRVITLFCPPPSKYKINKESVNFKNLEKIERTGNIFSIFKTKRFYISTKEQNKGKDVRSFLYSVNRYENAPENIKTEKGLYEACFYLLDSYLGELENFQSEIISQLKDDDEIFDKMNQSMRKFIAPWLFKGSIDADEFRFLSDAFLNEVFKKLILMKDKESYMLNDRVLKNLSKASLEVLRGF